MQWEARSFCTFSCQCPVRWRVLLVEPSRGLSIEAYVGIAREVDYESPESLDQSVIAALFGTVRSLRDCIARQQWELQSREGSAVQKTVALDACLFSFLAA